MAKTRYTIAIMDEEAKERAKFANFFDQDFNIFEIPSISSVDGLIDKIKAENIDAIAIDYKLKEHHSRFKENGDYFFKQLISRLQEFPAFVLTQDAEKAKRESKLIKPRFIIDKEIYHKLHGNDKKAFMNDIISEINTYKKSFTEKLKRLKELEKIKKNKKLNDSLENEYLNLNNEISQSLSGYQALPLKYFSQDTNKKLDEVLTKTDELIKNITKKK
ncbi:MAG TPA: hypothetical protein VK809_04495 [Bacteroidia bacterium]|jgi:hypothetical protein|nr:hypothetical protein [Bacteroidia bacterium]